MSSRLSTTSWAATLGARYPIIQAPMAGVSHTHHMASKAIEVGAIGSIGGANLDPDCLRDEIRSVKRRLTHNQSASNIACLNVNLQAYGEFAVSAPPTSTPTTAPSSSFSSSSASEANSQDFDPVSIFRQSSQKWLDAARKYEFDHALSQMLKLNPTSPAFASDLEKYQQLMRTQAFDEYAARFGKEAFERKYYKSIEVILQERPAMFTTIFGFIEPQLLRVMHRYGIVVGATTTCFVTDDDLAAIEKEEEATTRIKKLKVVEEERDEDAVVEFTPSLLKQKQKASPSSTTSPLLAPTTEAVIQFESGVDFLFLQTTHAGGHQGTVSAPLPIPHPQYCSGSNTSGAQQNNAVGGGASDFFVFARDPIIEQTDPGKFHRADQTPVEALIDLRRSFSRQLARNLENSLARRRAARSSCPFPAGHPFSKEFDARRSSFLDQNCFLIGCGGIATGKDVVDVMNGAQVHGASIGSRFLLAKESKSSDLHQIGWRKFASAFQSESDEGDVAGGDGGQEGRRRKQQQRQQQQVFTRAFSGRWCRAVETQYIRNLDERNHIERVLPYPLQLGVTEMRRAKLNQIMEIETSQEAALEGVELANLLCGSQTFKHLQKDDGRSTEEIMTEICEEFSREYIKSKIEGSKSSGDKETKA